jgi:hypothetical protein
MHCRTAGYGTRITVTIPTAPGNAEAIEEAAIYASR